MSFKDHLLIRNYDPSLYINQTIYEENNLLVVHIYNLDGMFTGYQRYNPIGNKDKKPNLESKYLTYTMKGEKAFWGLETIDYSKDTLYVVEGLFKASALHRLGLNAICVFGNSAKHLSDVLLSFNMKLIAICDNDDNDAGLILGRSVERMGGNYVVFDKDLDEYDLSELELIFN